MHTSMQYATFGSYRSPMEKGKTRTILLLNPDTSFKSFGSEAEYRFSELSNEDILKYYFFDFKNMDLGTNTCLNDDTNKQMPGKDVFCHIIRHLKSCIENDIKYDFLESADKDIWYTLAIPEAWYNQQKCIMEAAILAGIDKERIVMIQKSEAAVSNLRHVLMLQSVQPAVKPGDKIMVAYLGGKTAHFSSYEAQAGSSFKQRGCFAPRFICGNSVNTAFIEYLENIFGSDNMENFKRNNFQEFTELCNNFQVFKHRALLRGNGNVAITLPKELSDLKLKLKPSSEFSTGHHHLALQYDTISGFAQPLIERIVTTIQECFLKKEFDDVSIIMMAGGFSECKLVQTAIHKTFENKQVYISDEPKLEVLSGGIVCDQIVKSFLSHSESELREAFDVALQFNHDDVAQELIKAGADVNIANLPTYAFYALEDICIAVEDNNIPSLEKLMSLIFTTDLKKKVWNILYVAAVKGTSEMCNYLIEQGFSTDSDTMPFTVAQIISCQNKDDISHLSPLSVAIYYKNRDNIKTLAHYSNESSLAKCIDLEPEIETVILKEISEKLKTKYKALKPTVVAGHKDGEALLLVYSDSSFYPKEENYGGRKVIIKSPRYIQRQDMTLENTSNISQENMTIAKQVINDSGNYLWKTHSNLNIVTVSSSKYVSGEKQTTDCCITLYCTSKGFIPLGEKMFPATLSTLDKKHNIPVDIREGYFELCPLYETEHSSRYHQRLKMGCLIGNAKGGLNGGGTLGPFVNFNGQTGFLTCAHVLFDINQVPFTYHFSPFTKVDVVQPAADVLGVTEHQKAPLGHVMEALFDPDKGIDAAVVTITDITRLPEKGQFAINQKSNLRTESFTELPVFNTGVTRDPKDVKPWIIVCKFGSKTHLTSGQIKADGTQVRPFHKCFAYPIGQFEIKEQMEITSVGNVGAFAQPGDSGSAVFTRREDGSLECIGMIIGCTSYHSAIVTPINAILGPGIALKTFA